MFYCFLFLFSLVVPVEEKPLWFVVTTPHLKEAIEPLAAQRAKEGFDVKISTEGFETSRKPSYLLIVGDYEKGMETEAWCVPSLEKPLYRWMLTQRKTFASDAAHGDLNGDNVPELPVGRIPARSKKQVKLMVDKILAYESRPISVNDLCVNVWSGSPGYNPQFDAMATQFMITSVQSGAPLWLDFWLIAGDENSCFCAWPELQGQFFSERTLKGGLISVLMGHANADHFFSMYYNKKGYGYKIYDALPAFDSGPPTPPMIFFSCDTGNFERPKNPCFAESLLFMPAGPVSVIAASTNSHPLTNYFTSTSLLKEFHDGSLRVGDLWFKAQEQASKKKLTIFSVIGQQLKEAEGKLEKEINVKKLKRDQLLMYALLGDPATRMRFPKKLAVTLKDKNQWRVEKPLGAESLVVSFRSTNISSLLSPKKIKDINSALDDFIKANNKLGFSKTKTYSKDEPWEGAAEGSGVLRMVAIGPDAIHACALKIK